MPRHAHAAATVLLLAAAAAIAQPVPPPATAPATRPSDDDTTASLTARFATLRHRKIAKMSELFTATVDDDVLHLHTPPFKPDDEYAVDLPAWPGFAEVVLPPAGGYQFHHTMLAVGDTVEVLTELYANPGAVTITRGTEWPTGTHTVQLLQSDQPDENTPPVRLYIQDLRDGIGPKNLTVGAATFGELCRDHPDLVRAELRPIFRDLGMAAIVQSSDPAKAYQVLGGTMPSDPAVRTHVDELLKRLAGPDAAARTKAEADLLATGPAGAAELRRRDLSDLPPDPRSVADNAVRQAEPLDSAIAEQLASDVPFLLDTLSLDDANLTIAAVARIKTLTGKTIDLPAKLPATERDKRIAAFAATLGPATRPTSVGPTTAPETIP